MSISNLAAPIIPCLAGTIQVWSGRWTNVNEGGTNIFYNVTMIDSQLVSGVPSFVQNLSAQSTNLMIGDVLNVFNSLFLDVTSLTLSTNASAAPTARGELNLTSGDIVWSDSLPKLQYLTNYGRISALNTIYFASNSSPPWLTGTLDGPYQTFVNHGPITSVGSVIWANYLEASATINSGTGPISVQAGTAVITNGTFSAPFADISFNCGSLSMSNQSLQAGRALILTVTNLLDDGSLSNNVTASSYNNGWTVSAGIQLTRLPANSSLLDTVVANNAPPNSLVPNVWAAQDRGGFPSGYVNNAALGYLALDGQDSGSLFTFGGPTGDVPYALYVDAIEFIDATTNSVPSNVSGKRDFIGIDLAPNFTIYFGQAIAKGQSIAETLNGSYGVADTNGGHFTWVSNYNTGFFSSMNVLYSDGTTHRLNAALATSRTIDSNGNGVANSFDVNPIPVLSPSGLALSVTVTNGPGPKAILSWNTIPLTSNYLYVSSSPFSSSTNWQLVTNFLSANVLGGKATVTTTITNNGPRYYRVRATSP
jgi:hypothetical protein